MRCLLLLALLLLHGLPGATRAASITNQATATAFVRAAAPSLNYGGAGALAVSGSDAVNSGGVSNGRFDSVLRFPTGAMVAAFDARFGAGNWTLQEVWLHLTEVAFPNNPIFNRGIGTFEARWLANNDWTEGVGRPNLQSSNGITFESLLSLLDPETDASLGHFSNTGTGITHRFQLDTPSRFVSELLSGRPVSLHLTPSSPTIGFNFYSRSFATVQARPQLVVVAAPRPVIESLTPVEGGLQLTALHIEAGTEYRVLHAPSLTLPPAQWTPVATGSTPAEGTLSILIPGSLLDDASTHFFMLQSGD